MIDRWTERSTDLSAGRLIDPRHIPLTWCQRLTAVLASPTAEVILPTAAAGSPGRLTDPSTLPSEATRVFTPHRSGPPGAKPLASVSQVVCLGVCHCESGSGNLWVDPGDPTGRTGSGQRRRLRVSP